MKAEESWLHDDVDFILVPDEYEADDLKRISSIAFASQYDMQDSKVPSDDMFEMVDRFGEFGVKGIDLEPVDVSSSMAARFERRSEVVSDLLNRVGEYIETIILLMHGSEGKIELRLRDKSPCNCFSHGLSHHAITALLCAAVVPNVEVSFRSEKEEAKCLSYLFNNIIRHLDTYPSKWEDILTDIRRGITALYGGWRDNSEVTLISAICWAFGRSWSEIDGTSTLTFEKKSAITGKHISIHGLESLDCRRDLHDAYVNGTLPPFLTEDQTELLTGLSKECIVDLIQTNQIYAEVDEHELWRKYYISSSSLRDFIESRASNHEGDPSVSGSATVTLTIGSLRGLVTRALEDDLRKSYPDVLKTADCAKILDISHQEALSRLRNGEIPGAFRNGKHWCIGRDKFFEHLGMLPVPISKSQFEQSSDVNDIVEAYDNCEDNESAVDDVLIDDVPCKPVGWYYQPSVAKDICDSISLDSMSDSDRKMWDAVSDMVINHGLCMRLTNGCINLYFERMTIPIPMQSVFPMKERRLILNGGKPDVYLRSTRACKRANINLEDGGRCVASRTIPRDAGIAIQELLIKMDDVSEYHFGLCECSAS